MCESTVADSRPRNRREPAIEYREFQRKCSQDRQLFLWEVVHDLLRMLHVHLLIEIALYEALHVGRPAGIRVPSKNLQVHGRKVVIGIRIKLTLKLRQRLRLDQRASGIRITELVSDAINRRIVRLERSQHVVKRPVLHHYDDDVLELIQPGCDSYAPELVSRYFY